MEAITKDIIISASNGDMDAFETIYRQASGFVYNVALRMAASEDIASEITQDVFVKLHSQLKAFRHESAFTTWLYRITVNMTLNALKKNSRFSDKTVDIETLADFAAREKPLHKQAEEREEKDKALKLLDSLPADQKICLILRDVEDMSYNEIADALNTKLNTVRTRLKRARETLVKRAAGGNINEMQ